MVELTHLLQTHDVCVQGGHGVAQIVDFQTSGRPHATHTLVDVVRGHAQMGCMARKRRKQGGLKRFEHVYIPATKRVAMATSHALR